MIKTITLDPAAEVNPANTDELTEGITNKYDTGVPPADTDALPAGLVNKYDTGVPPATLEELPDGATRLAMADAEKTKLTGIEVGAKDDQTGEEVRDAILGLSDIERKLVKTNPLSGEFPVTAAQMDSAEKLRVDYDDVPIV